VSADTGSADTGRAAEAGACNKDELRGLFLFEGLTEEQLDWLCSEGRVVELAAGPVYTEGDPATCF
jgi:hypothetical protein